VLVPAATTMTLVTHSMIASTGMEAEVTVAEAVVVTAWAMVLSRPVAPSILVAAAAQHQRDNSEAVV
jgi:hypothetical protein